MGRIREFLSEWRARRQGRRYAGSTIYRSARDIVGPTGNMFSNGWDLLDQKGERYVESFDPRIPPSEFVSKRDRTRHNIPIPLVERCIEDHAAADD